MTADQLCALFEAFANYYWSAPAEFVASKIMEWHPEVTMEQIAAALKKCNDKPFNYHCCLLKDGLDEPEIATEHLYALGDENLDNFLAARIDGPYCDCDEETLLLLKKGLKYLDIPEVKAILDFGKNDLHLDDEWAEQLLDDCQFNQATALCEGKSWVQEVLFQESYAQIRFSTVEQVEKFRALGNQLYRVLPNPVLKGWKPTELESPPILLDDIPERDEDIPNHHKDLDELFDRYGGRENLRRMVLGQTSGPVRRNDPCPCGSGKKYKKCCGKKVE